MNKEWCYEITGNIQIVELVYKYGEEDPVDEKDLSFKELKKEELNSLIKAVKGNSEGLEKYIYTDFSNVPGIVMGRRSLEELRIEEERKVLKTIVKKIEIGINEEGSIAIVTCKKELTEQQEETLVDYITGQYSDGWGESFFQYPFYEGDRVLVADFSNRLFIKKLS